MNKLLSATLLAGMTASAYGQADVRQAVRWEQTKERAAARQAAVERGGAAKEQREQAASEPAGARTAPESGVQAAIRYERFKEAAATRQARTEARGGESRRNIDSADRKKLKDPR